MAIKAQLFTKIEGVACSGVKFDGFQAPKNAHTFNRVTGVGPKGDFDIVSFFSKDGQIVRRFARYTNDWDGETLKMRVWNNSGFPICETIKHNGKLTEVTHDDFYGTARDGEILRTRERHVLTGDRERSLFSFGVFNRGKSPRKIIFETMWNGEKPRILYQNTKGTLTAERQEYLPLTISKRKDKMPWIEHIVKVNEKDLEIEGIAPPIRLFPFEELHQSEYRTPKEARKAEVLSSGFTQSETAQVSIWKKLREPDRIIGVIAHEYFHVGQFVDTSRLQHNARIFTHPSESRAKLFTNEEIGRLKETSPEFLADYLLALRLAKKSVAKGILTKQNTDPNFYWYLKRIDKYSTGSRYEKEIALGRPENHIVEVGAYRRQDREQEKFYALMNDVDRVLDISI